MTENIKDLKAKLRELEQKVESLEKNNPKGNDGLADETKRLLKKYGHTGLSFVRDVLSLGAKKAGELAGRMEEGNRNNKASKAKRKAGLTRAGKNKSKSSLP